MRHLFLAAGLLAFASHAHATEPGLNVAAGGSPSLFSNYKDLTADTLDVNTTRNYLNNRRQNYELGFAQLGVHAPVPLEGRTEWPSRFAFFLRGEGAGFVAAPNPLRNELRITRIFAGYLKAQFEGNLAEDLYFEMGFVLGAGGEKEDTLLDNGASFTRNQREATTILAGVDARIQKIWRVGRGARWVNTLQTEETYFKGLREKKEGVLSRELRPTSHDWLFRNDLLLGNFNLHAIAGRHPYPVRLLPRVWNRVAAPGNYDDFASQWGAGLGYTVRFRQDAQLALLAGYYAGAAGGDLRFRMPGKFGFRLSSYGVENSGAYGQFNERAYAAGLDIDL